MINIRLSTPTDIPALRQLWELAFGDSGAYVDNFFDSYYRPERMIVLEADGAVRSMTAWFDTTFAVPGKGEYRAAYLYAVATHPDCRGQGLAAKLLDWADGYFRSLDIPAVTTVPAEPSLHNFFGVNGFRECFVLSQYELLPTQLPAENGPCFRSVSPSEYGALRERLLSEIPHISYPEDALTYQAGCCSISGYGLFAADTPAGPVILCAEGAGNGLVILKEYLGCPTAKRLTLSDLHRTAPADRWLVREPVFSPSTASDTWKFAMLKWLDESLAAQWNWSSIAYLGLAFD